MKPLHCSPFPDKSNAPMTSKPIPARMRGLNRAEIRDQNFVEFVREWNGNVST